MPEPSINVKASPPPTDPAQYTRAIWSARSVGDILLVFRNLFPRVNSAYERMLVYGGMGNPDPEEVLRKVQTAKDLYSRLKTPHGAESAFHAGKALNDLLLNCAEDVLSEMVGIDLLDLRWAASEATSSSKVGHDLKEEFSQKAVVAIQSTDSDGIIRKMVDLSKQEKEVINEFGPQLRAIDEMYGPKVQAMEKKYQTMKAKRDAFAIIDQSSGTFLRDATLEKPHESQEYKDYLEALRDLEDAYMAVWNQKKDMESEWFNAQEPLNDAMRAKLKPIQDEIISIRAEFYERIKDEVLQTSPVSEAQAEAWSNAQEVASAAKKRLDRQGYKIEALRKDMAEFYRFTGGRLPNVSIVTEGRRRACAHRTFQQVSIDNHFKKETLFHEMAHVLENDPVILSMAIYFRNSRGKGQAIVSLRKLDPGKNYRSDERAIKDEFFDPYVGKVYSHGSTEVMSMGLQMFSNDEAAQRLLSADPEMFNMIYGMLLSPPPTDVFKGRMDEAVEKKMKSDRKASFFNELAKLSKSGEFMKGREQWVRLELFGAPMPPSYSVRAITADGKQFMTYWKRSKSAAYAFAYLYLLDGTFMDNAVENALSIIKNQIVPSWYKNPDNPDSLDHIPELP